MKKTLQKGRSMIEMLGVLAIFGILTVTGFELVSKVHSNKEINETIDNIHELASKARSVAREYETESAGTYSRPAANISSILNTRGAYPADLTYNESGYFTNDAGMTFAVHTLTSADGLFYIAIAGTVSENICMEIASTNWGSSSTNGLMGINILASTQTQPAQIKSGMKTKWGLSEAATKCSGGNKKIYLIYR